MKTKKTRLKNYIPKLVEHGHAIQCQILFLNVRLKGITDQLEAAAAARLDEHVPLQENDSGGSRWITPGNGCECHVVFPEARLRTFFDPRAPGFLPIRSLASSHFRSLFRKVTLYAIADRKNFRSQVKRFLAEKDAEDLLELCTSAVEPQTFFQPRRAGKEQV